MISVVIPVYNAEKYLEKCVGSIMAQKGIEKEIILIDDGSTDNSPKLCDRLSNSYTNKVKVIHKENEGVFVARNVGIEAALGEWIAFVDADDDVEKGMFQAYYSTITRLDMGANIALIGYRTVDADGIVGEEHGLTMTALWKRGEGYSELFGSVSQNLNERAWLYYYVWNKLYKREIIV